MIALRTRWAALGAAVAVSLGAGGLGVVQAVADEEPKPILVPVNPCRVMDTRSFNGFTVGPRSTPIAGGETYEVKAAGGVNGDCDEVPASAVGVVMNVTITNPALATHVTIWPSDEPRPNSSNLNTIAGAPPVPNLVTTGLSADGMFSIYNFQGSVNVVADIVGYYEDHDHDDRYYTKDATDQLIEDAAIGDVDLSDYLTETEINALFGDYLTETEINALIDNFLDETEITTLISTFGFVTDADLPSFHSGDGAPTDGVGDDGDMYFDATGRVLYGPKAAGTWPTPGTPLGGGSIGGQTRSGDLPLATLLAFAPLDLDDEVTSFGTGITYDTGDDEFTIAEAGVYRVSYTANVTAGLLGTTFQVRVDGVPQGSPLAVATVGGSVSDTLLVDVAAGQTVDLAIGGVINVALGGQANFTIERVA